MAKTRNRRNKHALVHGVYSSDIVLSYENPDQFYKLLAELRDEYQPEGASEGEVVFDLAVLYWRKRRILKIQQLALYECSLVLEAERSGKRSVRGIRRHLLKQDEEDRQGIEAGMIGFDRELKALTKHVKRTKQSGMQVTAGKLEQKARHVQIEMQKLRPRLEVATGHEGPGSGRAAGKILKALSRVSAVEARLDAQIDKKIQRLIVLKEYKRLYGPAHSPKLIEHRPVVRDRRAPQTLTRKPVFYDDKSDAGVNDNDNDNDNDNYNDDLEYDWEHEYDEDKAAEAKEAKRAKESKQN